MPSAADAAALQPPAGPTDDAVVRHILRSVVTRVLAIKRSRAPDGKSNPADAGLITETLAAFVVRATVLNPDLNFRLDAIFSRDDVDRLIENCSKKIVQDGNPEAETVKMQVYFDSTFPQQAEYLHREKQARKNTVAGILRDITEWANGPSARAARGGGAAAASALDSLYRKIVGYVLLKTAMGNPTDIQVARETAIALESVFPQSEVATFLSLLRPDKEKQLNGLAQLVAGIRLFNRHVNKASKDKIENIPELCSREVKDAFSIIQEKTAQTEQKIKMLTALVAARAVSDSGNSSIPGMTGAVTSQMISTLVFYRQLLIYLDTVRTQIEASSNALRVLDDRMVKCLQDLGHACKARSAVPVDQVYPRFMELAAVWQGFQDELFLDAFRRGVIDTVVMLETHVRSEGLHLAAAKDPQIPPQERNRDDPLLADLSDLVAGASEEIQRAVKLQPVEVPAQPDDQIVAAAVLLQSEISKLRRQPTLLAQALPEMTVLHPGNTAQYFKLPAELGGFCPVSLVEQRTRGMAVPGNWNIGIVKYNDKLYAFRSIEEARKFALNPDKHIAEVLEIARRHMNLVQLLQLWGYFPSIRALENAEALTRQALLGQRPLVCEVGTQVDTHMVDKHIDPDYEWNEWAMRRRALMLVNLRTKATHGAQTSQSHFKRDAHAQVYAMRESMAQTMRESGTSMPKREVKLPLSLLGLE